VSSDSDRSSDEGDESEKEGSPQDTLPDHPYWDQPTGREARWGVWNTQNSLSCDDVPNSVLEWANARSLDAVLLSEPGLVSTSTTLFFRENGCQFFRTPPGTLSVAVILMPGIIPVGAPKASALGGTLTVRALVRGGVVSFTAVYQPTGLGTAPGPATYIPFPRAPPRSRGNLRKGTYTRAVGEYQRGVITKALTASGAHLAVAGGDFNEPPDPHLDRSLVVPNGPTRGKGRSHTVRRLLRSFYRISIGRRIPLPAARSPGVLPSRPRATPFTVAAAKALRGSTSPLSTLPPPLGRHAHSWTRTICGTGPTMLRCVSRPPFPPAYGTRTEVPACPSHFAPASSTPVTYPKRINSWCSRPPMTLCRSLCPSGALSSTLSLQQTRTPRSSWTMLLLLSDRRFSRRSTGWSGVERTRARLRAVRPQG
jgi:hypothetical protein